MKVAIIRYNAGNVESVRNALVRLGAEPILTDDAQLLRASDKVIFPGVGEASTAMSYLRKWGLDEVIASLRQPVLGICLGMHLLCQSSAENKTECLGVLPHKVERFLDGDIRVPHIGWNNISGLRSPLFEGIAEDSRVYFVHGYFVPTNEDMIAETTYGSPFSAAVAYKNFHAVQFHPEKSGSVGARILENFLNI
jgi:glutamine amidotransferase